MSPSGGEKNKVIGISDTYVRKKQDILYPRHKVKYPKTSQQINLQSARSRHTLT